MRNADASNSMSSSSSVVFARRALTRRVLRALTGYTRRGGAWVRDEVADAVAAHQPVIALESTIISHGLLCSLGRVHTSFSLIPDG